MKKQNKSFKLFSVLVAAFLIFSSCQIGLGSAIDLEAPEVFLTSHKDSDYVGQNFRLAGTASDNEKVKKLSIDFDEADIHFVLENGVWKKKTSYTADWVTISADESLATVDGKTVNWAIDVSTEEAKSGIDSTYIFTIVVEDFVGNSGKNSKLEGSLIVDENIPEISIKTPELFKTNTDLTAEYEKLQLQDGNVLSQLLNGTLVLEGRQDSAASFKEFRIEFDNGIVDSKTVDSTNFDIPIGSVTTEIFLPHILLNVLQSIIQKLLQLERIILQTYALGKLVSLLQIGFLQRKIQSWQPENIKFVLLPLVLVVQIHGKEKY